MTLLNIIQTLQQVIVNSLFVRILLYLYGGLFQIEKLWRSSIFHRYLEKAAQGASRGLVGRYFSSDPLERLQRQRSSSFVVALGATLTKPVRSLRLKFIDLLEEISRGSIVATIVRHLACPEGWQLGGLARAGLAFLVGLTVALALLGAMTFFKAFVFAGTLLLFYLWRNSLVTVQAIWDKSVPAKVTDFFVPSALQKDEPLHSVDVDDNYRVAPPLEGFSAYVMYGLLLLFGAVIGFLWVRFNSPYVLVLPLILLSLQLLFFRPILGLWALALYGPIDWFLRQQVNMFGIPTWWDEALLLLMVGAIVAHWLSQRDFQWKHHPTFYALTAFIAIMLFMFLIDYTYPRIQVPIDGLRVIVQHMLWFYLAVQLLRHTKEALTLLVGFTLATTLIALHGVYQYITGAPMPSTWVDQAEVGIRTRAYSIIGSPNVLGGLLVLSTPIALALAYRGTPAQRLFYLGCAAVMGLCMVVTFSRGAWLGLALGIILFGAIYDRRLIAAFLIGAILLPIALPSVADRVSYLLSPDYMNKSAQGGRIDRWNMALDKVQEKPLTGIGLGQFGGAAADHNKNLLGHRTIYTDNYYLKTAAETGLIGLVSFIALMIAVMRMAFGVAIHAPPRLKALATGIACGLTGVVFHNAVENVFEVPMMVILFWLFVALVWKFREPDSGVTKGA
ncbi:O-antigen ligase family protein [Heliorestis convoluta]|uniref:O-antigen polymerase family protein n=1 Tax=Heliorestis convoluta TaxID=356322 RepID=A0A5Q2N4G2_9FIRM|nr:O-antigen ligase family protein [Heliorestis convoluta]QGG47465.1 O-antigen polymerase family protein [Heliorestis convoluta]